MAYFYKLELREGAHATYRQPYELVCYNGVNRISGQSVKSHSNNHYYGEPEKIFNDIQAYPDMWGFSNGAQLAWMVFESPEKITAFELFSRPSHPVKNIRLYLIEDSTAPAYNDARWHELYASDSYNSSGDTADKVFLQETIRFYLLRNAAGATFNYATGSFSQVNASAPVESDFTTNGMATIPDIPVSELMAWEPTGNFTLEYYNSDATDVSVKALSSTSVPKARIALPKNTISVSGVSELNGINIVQNLAATGASRFAVSVDGSSWRAWNGSGWVDLNALAVDQNSADYLMANGMTAAQVTALSWTELQQLYTGNPTAIAVAYGVEAKAINDTAEIDHVELTVTHSGQKWVRDHGEIELEITGSHFTATPAINCTYKVNYQDTAA